MMRRPHIRTGFMLVHLLSTSDLRDVLKRTFHSSAWQKSERGRVWAELMWRRERRRGKR